MADRHVIIQTNELYQSGVKGMKKGIRRWQNEDGSYTPAGRIHYGIGTSYKGTNSDSKELGRLSNAIIDAHLKGDTEELRRLIDNSQNNEERAKYKQRAAEARNKSHDAYYEKTEDMSNDPNKYSKETYEELRSGKYKDLADTIDRETAEKKKAAQKATQKYVDSGKNFFEKKTAKVNRQKALNDSKQATADYLDDFFSVSEKYIQENFTKEQWDDARAFVFDHSELWW